MIINLITEKWGKWIVVITFSIYSAEKYWLFKLFSAKVQPFGLIFKTDFFENIDETGVEGFRLMYEQTES